MREKQASQQAQIDSLSQQVAAKDAALTAAQTSAGRQDPKRRPDREHHRSGSVSSSIQANTDAVTAVKSDVSDLKTSNVGLATTISATKTELNEKIDSPASIHYKGITITPVAFFAFEGVLASAFGQLRHQHSVQLDSRSRARTKATSAS